MRLDISRTALLGKIDAYLAREHDRFAQDKERWQDEFEDWRVQAATRLGDAFETMRDGVGGLEDPDIYDLSHVPDLEDKTLLSIHDRYSSDETSEITVQIHCKLPVPVEPVDLYAQRDRELVAGSSKTTISIGPDDHLYRYLAAPEDDTRRSIR